MAVKRRGFLAGLLTGGCVAQNAPAQTSGGVTVATLKAARDKLDANELPEDYLPTAVFMPGYREEFVKVFEECNTMLYRSGITWVDDEWHEGDATAKVARLR